MMSTFCPHYNLTTGLLAHARMVVLDYYDGPRQGIFECSLCSNCLRFDMLAWDDQQDARVFELNPVVTSAIAQVYSVLAELDRVPPAEWVPLWLFPNRIDGTAIENQLLGILTATGPSDSRMAWIPHPLGYKVLASRHVDSEAATADVIDWFDYLGITVQSVPLDNPRSL